MVVSSRCKAEKVFAAAYPELYRHLTPWKDRLISHRTKGASGGAEILLVLRVVRRPKIVWQEIQYSPAFALDYSAALSP